MQYSTMGFIGSLRPIERRYLWGRRYDLVDPFNGAAYGYVIELGPIAVFKIMGWFGERMTVVKVFQKELVW
jgi:hypothetical protein